jgi:hypothetical protein
MAALLFIFERDAFAISNMVAHLFLKATWLISSKMVESLFLAGADDSRVPRWRPKLMI